MRFAFVDQGFNGEINWICSTLLIETAAASPDHAAVNADCNVWCEQPRERPRPYAVGDRASVLGGALQLRELQRQLIIHRRVIEGQRTWKEAIASDAVGMNGMWYCP